MRTQPERIIDTKSNLVSTTDRFVFSKELNAEFLKKSYGHNLEFGKKMFKVFLSTIEEDMQELTDSYNAKDYVAMGKVAHKIKNNFNWVGLPLLSSLTYRIEQAAKEDSKSIEIYYKKLMSVFHDDHKLVVNEYNRMNDHLK